ncbi:MAG TPA: site-2 protease family protein [Nanoarchaeota archaeon]|nr:site-2 protease family protein [Nanoarchaeota archaeon]
MDKKELQDIAISVIVLSVAFLNIIGDFTLENFVISLLIVIFVFVVHELAHRGVAKYYGFSAKYVAWPFGLLLTLLTSFGSFLLGGSFLFAAPGAVQISPYSDKFAFQLRPMTKKEYGIIALSGPASNIAVGVIFFLLFLIFPSPIYFLYNISKISFWLAFFNLLPIPPLDGSKILIWNIKIWFIIIAFAFIGWMVI